MDSRPSTVLFNPSEKQTEFLKAAFSKKFNVILFGGAIRGGKTYAGLGTLLLLCRFYPESVWAVVRDSLPTLKRTTIKSFMKICPKAFIKSYNQETQTVTFANKSQIIFFPENYDDDKELDRWKGLEVNGFLLEECNELQEVSFFKAIERAGSLIPREGVKKPHPLVLMTCNPSNNWVKELIYNRWAGKEGYEELPHNWKYIPSKITDNPFVMQDASYLESLKQLPTYQYRVFVEGDWDIQLKVGGEYLKCFELDKHIVKNRMLPSGYYEQYDPSLPLHISWDDNVNPYLPCGIHQVRKTVVQESGKDITYYEPVMIDAIAAKSPNNRVRSVCDEIIRKYPNHNSGMYVYGDATAEKDDTKMELGFNFYRLILDYLKKYHPQSRVMTHNPNVVMRQNWINSVLEKEVGRIRILIGENCREAVNDFIGLKEDVNGGKNKEMETDPKTKVRYQKYGHFVDLFEYFMVSAFTREFDNYQAGEAVASVRFGKSTQSKHSYGADRSRSVLKTSVSKNSY